MGELEAMNSTRNYRTCATDY